MNPPSAALLEADPATQDRFINGLDDIGLTLEKARAIAGFRLSSSRGEMAITSKPWLTKLSTR